MGKHPFTWSATIGNLFCEIVINHIVEILLSPVDSTAQIVGLRAALPNSVFESKYWIAFQLLRFYLSGLDATNFIRSSTAMLLCPSLWNSTEPSKCKLCAVSASTKRRLPSVSWYEESAAFVHIVRPHKYARDFPYFCVSLAMSWLCFHFTPR